MRIDRVILALVCALSLLPSAGARASESQLGLHLSPCSQGKAKVPAECGTFGVYENREAHSGRIIPLNVIVIPAKHPMHRAMVEIAGGPGQGVTEFAAPIIDGGFGASRIALHDTYDFLFMDDRGMGKSNPFPCNFTPPNDPGAYFRYIYPRALVAACRAKSATTHTLSAYNTNNSVDDLDDLRAALGYEKMVVSGGSYGTFFSLVYMRRHPTHVESAILDGVSPPHFQAIPGEPMGVQRVLDDLFTKCRKNAVCNAHFPQFPAHFLALLQRFDKGPVAVPAMNLATKRTQTVALSKEVFVDTLRHLLYDPFPASYIPYVVERAYGHDYAPLGRVIQTAAQLFSSDLNMGAFLSYSCSDWMPFVSQSALNYARTHSFAGDLRIRAQRRACAIWGVPAKPASFNDPVRSDAPVLMILGSDDPATPPQYGEEALRYLPNGRAVLVKGAGHGADTDCTDKLELQFVRARSAKGLDVSKCSATFKLPPFATSMKGWP